MQGSNCDVPNPEFSFVCAKDSYELSSYISVFKCLFMYEPSLYISHQKEKSRAIATQVFDAQPHFYTKTYQHLEKKSGLVTFFLLLHVLE